MKLQCNYDRNHCKRPSRNLCFLDTMHQWQTYFINNRGKNLILFFLNNTYLTFLMTKASNTLHGYIMIKISHNEKKNTIKKKNNYHNGNFIMT